MNLQFISQKYGLSSPKRVKIDEIEQLIFSVFFTGVGSAFGALTLSRDKTHEIEAKPLFWTYSNIF